MRRFGLVALLCALSLPGVAKAEECPGLTPERVVQAVPYLSASMRRETAADGALVFSHVDDPRLRVSVSLSRGVAPDPGQRRSEFLAEQRARLDAGAVGMPSGTTVRTSVGFEDPVSWTIQARTPAGDDVLSRGRIVVKLRPTCDMRISWDILETPNLIGRIRDITAAIEALRAGTGAGVVPSAFAPENSTPTGPVSFLLGVVAPLLGAAGFAYVFRSMARMPRPHPRIRWAGAAVALAAVAGAGAQAPAYVAHLGALRYADNATLLAAVALSLAAYVAIGASQLALAALALCLSAGVTLGLQAYLGWAPSLEVTVALSLLLTVYGGFGTWAWTAFPVRVKKAPRPAGIRTA